VKVADGTQAAAFRLSCTLVTDRRVGWKSPLVGTFVVAVVLLVAVSGWLLTDRSTTHADALRTGGLAAGSVVALYALWLNDRRRKVEERRQEIERERHELELLRAEREQDRVTDERFAKSVELLGSDADQGRGGGLHALAGVARNRPDYTQTVLDVICSYLRRPFEDATDGRDTAAQRELQVRLAAQRLIVDLLPRAGSEGPAFHLDLTGATLRYFSPAERKFGHLTMRYAKLYNSSNFSGCEFTGPAWFTQAETVDGRFICRDAVFRERAWFSGTRFGSLTDFTGTRFAGEASFKDATFAGDADFRETSFGASLDLLRVRLDGHLDLRVAQLPKGVAFFNTMLNPQREVQLPPQWEVEDLDDGRIRLSAVTNYPWRGEHA
jgi:pentapeptide repeat protein